jgi:hypothetical protein
MSNYSCKCPAPGCEVVFKAEADDWESAFRMIYPEGNQHIIDYHPDFPEANDRVKRARAYFKQEMKKR